MKFEELRKLAYQYYSRVDIQKALIEFAKHREVVPKYVNQFGKRPDAISYGNDINALVKKGATSFHSSEELWKDPLELNLEMGDEKIKNLRKGWDLILDIDCKFIEYSKMAAELLIKALRFNGIRNLGLKYSGNKGFHIGVSFEAFPEKLRDVDIRNFFPEGPRIMAAYLSELIKKHLAEKILDTISVGELAKNLNKKEEELLEGNEFNPYSILDIDTILISPRHLFRMPYSLHEKTGLVSIVIRPEQLKDFHPAWAKPYRIVPLQFLPKPEKDEARQLLLQALDWNSQQKQKSDFEKTLKKTVQSYVMGKRENQEISLKDANPEFYPPCVKKALLGMKEDGRKRALFILINFLKSLNMSMEEIEIKIDEWNKLNYKPLKKGYIVSQISWYKKQKTMPPPNCDKPHYKGIGICSPDFFCQKSRNPVYYVRNRLRLANQQAEQNEDKKGKRQKKQDKTKGF